MVYQVLKLSENITSKWVLNIKRILCDIGRHDLWLFQNSIGSYSLKYIVKQSLTDQYTQSWRSSMDNSSKSKQYAYLKDSIELEPYFICLPQNLYLNMVRFRTSNHKLPKETDGKIQISTTVKCTLCQLSSLGDE